MAGQFIDLHTHSSISDGTDSPAKLIDRAAACGLAAVALTDHDAINGLDEAEDAAGRLGIRFIRGCELAIKNPAGGELHILGLWLPKESGMLEKALASVRERRARRNDDMLARLTDMGMPLGMEDVLEFAKGVTPGRPHIAEALVAKGYVGSYREAFDRYIGESGSAFIPRTLWQPEEGIRLLAGMGATVSLAHPFLQADMTEEYLDALLADFRSWGMSALEAYHSAHTDSAVRLSLAAAERHGLLLTGGSDYHGEAKPDVRLGVCRGGMRVPVRILERLEEHRRQQGLWV